MSALCPCQSQQPYETCCGQWHQGPYYLQAPDAKLLMRSRYSAFVLDKLDYLLATWHPSTRPDHLEPNPSHLKWLGLDIRHHHIIDATQQRVEFVARHRTNGRATRLHEVSLFTLEKGRWYYVNGEFI